MVGGWATGMHRGQAMRPPDNSRRDYVGLAVSLALAAVFIYAGVDKIQGRLQFADSIAAFRILPAALINLFALGLPPFEIACGLLLLGPPTRRVGALAVALVSVLYLSALLSALVRGLTLDCGCFGTGTPSRPRMWLELGLDLVLFGARCPFICERLHGYRRVARTHLQSRFDQADACESPSSVHSRNSSTLPSDDRHLSAPFESHRMARRSGFPRPSNPSYARKGSLSSLGHSKAYAIPQTLNDKHRKFQLTFSGIWPQTMLTTE